MRSERPIYVTARPREAERRLMGCTGKVRFESFSVANKAARRHSSVGRREPYRCSFCNGFHLGRRLGK